MDSKKIVSACVVNHQEIKFLIEVGKDAFDEILACDELSDLIRKRNLEEAEDGSARWALLQADHQTNWLACPSHHESEGLLHNVKHLSQDA